MGELGTTNRVPKLHEAIRPPGSQAIPLGTPGQGAGPAELVTAWWMSLENVDLRILLMTLHHTNRPVPGAGGQTGSVRAPRHRPDQPAVLGQGENLPAAGDLPDLGRAVQAGRCQLRSARTPGQRTDQPELKD